MGGCTTTGAPEDEDSCQCAARLQSGSPCTNPATRTLDGEHLCGVHHRQRCNAHPECPVCLCAIKPRSRACMQCGHTYHTKCIRAWFRTRPLTCPMCRAPCLEGLAMLGPRVGPKVQGLIRTVPPAPRCFFPAYIVSQLQKPDVVRGLGDDPALIDLLVDIACECFTRHNFFVTVRGMGL